MSNLAYSTGNMEEKPESTSENSTKVNGSLADKIKSIRRHLMELYTKKDRQIDLTLACIFSGSHIIFEDIPGVGKTTFIKSVAKLLGTPFKRVQGTSDLLPSDILGVQVYDDNTKEFKFLRGPIFTNLLFMDELNRSSPRCQSALLQAMGEGHVSIDRETYPLPQPFIVIASQNAYDDTGTYLLPESQLDRFAVKLKLGYPDFQREIEIMNQKTNDPVKHLPEAILNINDILELQQKSLNVKMEQTIGQYAKTIVDATRTDSELIQGVSTRGALNWIKVSKAYATIQNRNYLIPDDLQFTAPYALAHRLICKSKGNEENVIYSILNKITV